jgi:hypothetical protein
MTVDRIASKGNTSFWAFFISTSDLLIVAALSKGWAMLHMHVDPSDLARGLSDVERKQVPIATVWALNDTAKDVLDHMQVRMRIVFDNPTRFATNAFMVWRANKSTMTAEIKERPSVGSHHFLKVQEVGGARPKTGLERLMTSRLAYDGDITAIVPASGAKLNSFGNWSPGERNKVLSAVQAQGDTRSNSTAASKSRRKTRVGYFVPRAGSKLSPGVWKRQGKNKLTKILHFTTAMPKYRARLGFYDGAEDVYEARFPINFSRAFEKAMMTAK